MSNSISPALDPKVVAPGFAQDGNTPPVAGQVASATSVNNFINSCLLTPQLPITNGKQIKTGSCNPVPMGVLPASTNQPSCKFVTPTNNQNIAAANTPFTMTLAITGMQTGNFVNAQTNYFAAPQTVNAQGQIVGHSHLVVQALTSLTQTTPIDPQTFAFFQGLDQPAANGQLSATVAKGLPAGCYKVSTINTAANHQPVTGPVAQHGSFDDAVYVCRTPLFRSPRFVILHFLSSLVHRRWWMRRSCRSCS
jgi:hypothetical protein